MNKWQILEVVRKLVNSGIENDLIAETRDKLQSEFELLEVRRNLLTERKQQRKLAKNKKHKTHSQAACELALQYSEVTDNNGIAVMLTNKSIFASDGKPYTARRVAHLLKMSKQVA